MRPPEGVARPQQERKHAPDEGPKQARDKQRSERKRERKQTPPALGSPECKAGDAGAERQQGQRKPRRQADEEARENVGIDEVLALAAVGARGPGANNRERLI